MRAFFEHVLSSCRSTFHFDDGVCVSFKDISNYKEKYEVLGYISGVLDIFKTQTRITLTSSGTTGVPKEIVVDESCLVPCLEHFCKKFKPSDRVLLVTPCGFDPFIIDVLCSLHESSAILFPPPVFDKERFKAYCKEHQPTILNCTPSFFATIERSSEVLCSLRRLGLGGEIPPSFVREQSFEIWSYYGSTELSVWTTEKKLFQSVCSSLTCLGPALPKTRIWINESETISMERGGTTFHSSDLGAVGSCGSIHFLGRKDDVCKRFGKAFSPFCIENQITSKLSFVRSCHVRVLDEVVVVAFVLSRLAKKTTKKHIFDLQLPELNQVIVLESIELSKKSSKISKEFLERVYEKKKEFRRGVPFNVSKKLSKLGINVDFDATLYEHGIDSLRMYIMAKEIEHRYGVELEYVLRELMYKNVGDWEFEMQQRKKVKTENDSAVVWESRLKKCVDLKGVIEGDEIYFACYDEFVYGFDLKTGEVKRSFQIGDVVECMSEGLLLGTRNGCVFEKFQKKLEIGGRVKGVLKMEKGETYFILSDFGAFVDRKRVLEGSFLSEACVESEFLSFVSCDGQLHKTDSLINVIWKVKLQSTAFLSSPTVWKEKLYINSVSHMFEVGKKAGFF